MAPGWRKREEARRLTGLHWGLSHSGRDRAKRGERRKEATSVLALGSSLGKFAKKEERTEVAA